MGFSRGPAGSDPSGSTSLRPRVVRDVGAVLQREAGGPEGGLQPGLAPGQGGAGHRVQVPDPPVKAVQPVKGEREGREGGGSEEGEQLREAGGLHLPQKGQGEVKIFRGGEVPTFRHPAEPRLDVGEGGPGRGIEGKAKEEAHVNRRPLR